MNDGLLAHHENKDQDDFTLVDLVPLVFRIEEGDMETLVRAVVEWIQAIKLLRRRFVSLTELSSLSMELRKELSDLNIKIYETQTSIFSFGYELNSIVEEIVWALNSETKVPCLDDFKLLTADRVDHKFSKCIDDCRMLMDKAISTAQLNPTTTLTELAELVASGVTLVRTFAEDLAVKQKLPNVLLQVSVGGIGIACACMAAGPFIGFLAPAAVGVGFGLVGALRLWYRSSTCEAKKILTESNAKYDELSRAISMALMRVSVTPADIDKHFEKLSQDPRQIVQLKAKVSSLDDALKLLCFHAAK